MKLNYKDLRYITIILALVKPVGIESISSQLNMIWNLFKLLAFIYLFLGFIKMSNRIKYVRDFTQYLLFCLGIFVSLFISTVFNQQSLLNGLINNWGTILMILLLIVISINENGMGHLIYCYSNVLNVLVIMNAVSIVYFPEGIAGSTRDVWILGNDNMMILYILPSIVLMVIRFSLSEEKLTDKIIQSMTIISSIYTIYIRWSATSVVIMTFILFSLLLFKMDFIYDVVKKFGTNIYLIFASFLFLSIVVYQFQERFANIIVDILGKDLTFTGRTYIWARAIQMLKNSWFFGNGFNMQVDGVTNMLSYVSSYVNIGHAHNYFLDIWLRGGIFAFIFFIITLFLVFKNLGKTDTKLSVYCRIIMFLICIQFIFEAYPTNLFNYFFLFGIFIVLPQLDSNQKSIKKAIQL